MEKSIFEEMFEFIKSCPLLKHQEGYNFAVVGVDNLESKPYSYSISVAPSSTVIKQYVNGDKIKQKLFIFSSMEYRNDSEEQNIENNNFYEELEKWIEESEDSLPYPRWTEVKVLSGGYMFNNEENAEQAAYQIQLRLKYFEPKTKKEMK